MSSTDNPMGVAPATFTHPRRWPRPVQAAAGAAVVAAAAAAFILGTGAIGRSEVQQITPAVATPTSPTEQAAAGVDWSKYRAGFRGELEGDTCGHLATAYTAAGLTDGVVDPAPLQRFIIAVSVAKDC